MDMLVSVEVRRRNTRSKNFFDLRVKRDLDGSYTIPPDGSLTFRYRVLIHQGDYRQGRVAEAYKEYASGR